MLWNGGEWDGHRFLRQETVRLFTSVQRQGIVDRTFSAQYGREVKPLWGFGFAKGPEEPMAHSWGSLCTSAAFGHGGMRSSVGFVEPTKDLVVVSVTNGLPTQAQNLLRFQTLCDIILRACR